MDEKKLHKEARCVLLIVTLMKGGRIIYEKMLEESARIEKEICLLNEKLKKYPDGKLICARDKNQYQWYQSDGHQKTYIPRKNRDLAEKLAVKKYLLCRLEDLENEKRAIGFYLRHHKADVGKADKLLAAMPYQKLLTPYFKNISEELQIWMNSSCEKNSKYPEQLIHKSSSGHLVRSKSEALIDMLLYIKKIPFRYECALQLGETIVYPDFTIRHPKTGEIYYWEHFGMMDNPSYAKSAFWKIEQYNTNGIIPSMRLITTYETKDCPLNSALVEILIAFYFL